MRRGFIIEHENSRALCTTGGKIILATNEEEIRNGPTSETVEIYVPVQGFEEDHTITVGEWLKDVKAGLDAR